MQNKKRYQQILSLLFLLLSIPACSFPRIIVLTDPLTPEEHLNLGVTYEKKGEFENAMHEYKQASKELPIAYLYIGNVYFQKDELDNAEYYYKKTIKELPENADAHNNLSWLYYTKREKLDDAEALALKAIKLNPSKEEVYKDTLQKIRFLKEQR